MLNSDKTAKINVGEIRNANCLQASNLRERPRRYRRWQGRNANPWRTMPPAVVGKRICGLGYWVAHLGKWRYSLGLKVGMIAVGEAGRVLFWVVPVSNNVE
jgi:hypothetical protein